MRRMAWAHGQRCMPRRGRSATSREGRRSSHLFSFCDLRASFFGSVNLEFFHSEAVARTRKASSNSHRASPTKFSAFGRCEEFSAVAFASELGATRPYLDLRTAASARALQHAEVSTDSV